LSSDPSDPFEAADPPPDIADALASSRGRRGGFGAPLLYFPTVGSTSDVAARLAGGGAPEGTTVVAEAQSAELVMPKRVSLPSMLPPGWSALAAWSTPSASSTGLPRCSAATQTSTSGTRIRHIAA
jgi:hypothetical protein